MKPLIFLFLFLAPLLFFSCDNKSKPVSRAFYYWKTALAFSPADEKRLTDLKIQKLFVRFFDVDLQNNKPFPVAKLNVVDLPPSAIEIIPVVFITNKTLLTCDERQIDSLSNNVTSLIDKTALLHQIIYREIQIDCDWSLATKQQYFSLLQQIKQQLPGKMITCTIRLHQVKYYSRTGVPPVDKGMLMFYNMGNLQSMNDNSIFNSRDAKKYVSGVPKYPLTLDVALPLFGWIKHFRQKKVIGLLNQLNEGALKQDTSFAFIANHRYAVRHNMFYKGKYLHPNDELVAEEITAEDATEAARLLKKYLKNESPVVVLYHWDPSNLSRYADNDVQNIYTAVE